MKTPLFYLNLKSRPIPARPDPVPVQNRVIPALAKKTIPVGYWKSHHSKAQYNTETNIKNIRHL